MRKFWSVAMLVIVVLLVSVGLGLVPVNLFFLKTTIIEVVGDRWDANLDIRGPLRIRFGFRPTLSASEIFLSQPGAAGKALVEIDKLSIRPRLFDVLGGNLHLRSLVATSVVFDYCPDRFPLTDSEQTDFELPSIAVDTLQLEDIQPRCSKPENRITWLPASLDLNASASIGMPVRLEISDRDSAEQDYIKVRGASIETLLQDPPAYSIELQLHASGSDLKVNGAVLNPLSHPVLNALIDLDSGHPSVLMAAIGIEIPDLEALTIKAEVQVSANEVQLERLEGTLGENYFTISGQAQNFLSRPNFNVDAQLAYLDLRQLSVNPNELAGEGRQNKAGLQPIFDVLSKFDARVHLQIDHVFNAPVPVDKLLLDIHLDTGVLILDRAELQLAGSSATIQARLDMQADCAQLTTEVQIFDVNLENLITPVAPNSKIGGQIGQANVRSSSCGGELDEHIDSLQVIARIDDVILRYSGAELPMMLDSVKTEFAWNQPGELSIVGDLLGEALSAEISFGAVSTIIAEGSWPLSITARGAESMLYLSGTSIVHNPGIYLQADLEFNVSRLGSLAAWMGVDPASQLTSSGRFQLNLGEKGIHLNQIDIQVGQSSLMGKMSWSGPGSDLPMRIDLRSERLNFDELAGIFPQPAEQADATRKSEPLSEIDWIDKLFTLPSIDIDLEVLQIATTNLDVEKVVLHGKLRDRLIEDGQLSLLFEEIEIEGSMDVDFREPPWRVSYQFEVGNIDIGRLLTRLNLSEDVVARAERMDFRLVSEGHSIKQLEENSRIESSIDSLYWTIDIGAENKSYEFYLSKLEWTVTPASPLVWQSAGNLNGVPIKAWMQAPRLSVILDPMQDLPLSLVISVGNEVFMLQTVIDRKVTDSLAATLVISGQRMDPENVRFSELESPLGEYELRSKVSLEMGALQFNELQARIGSSRASGHLGIQKEDAGYRFDFLLDSPFLETEDLVLWIKNRREASQQLAEDTRRDPGGKLPDGGIFPMITRQIESLTAQNTFDIRIDIGEFRSEGILLGSAQTRLLMDKNGIQLDPLQISLPGGNVDAKFTTRIMEDGLETVLNIHAENLEYGGLLRLIDTESEISGRLYLDTELISHSPDYGQVANNLEGHFDLVVFPEDSEAGVLDIWAANLIYALLPKVTDKRKVLNCVVARFIVENGVMKSKNVFLDSTDSIIRGRGTIDLGRHELNLLIAPQAKREKFLSIAAPIVVSGSFDDFTVGIAPGGFLNTMFRWYYGLVYVPWKWLTGERFPTDGLATCYYAMDWDLPNG